MKESTAKAVIAIIESDNDVSPEVRKAIQAACDNRTVKRRTCSAKIAMEVLQCSRPTLRRLAAIGTLDQLNITSRKVRFDLDQVEQLAYNGVNA